MKNYTPLLLLVLALVFGVVPVANAQRSKPCLTSEFQPHDHDHRMPDIYHVTTCGRYYPETYCFNVKPYIVLRGDGTGNMTEAEVRAELDRMDDTFNPHGINFLWDESSPIEVIQNTSFFNNPGSLFGSGFVSGSRIDIFL